MHWCVHYVICRQQESNGNNNLTTHFGLFITIRLLYVPVEHFSWVILSFDGCKAANSVYLHSRCCRLQWDADGDVRGQLPVLARLDLQLSIPPVRMLYKNQSYQTKRCPFIVVLKCVLWEKLLILLQQKIDFRLTAYRLNYNMETTLSSWQ